MMGRRRLQRLDSENGISLPLGNVDVPRKRTKLDSSGLPSDVPFDPSRLDLNDDLLIKILALLDNHIDFCRAAEVCRQWRDIATHNDLWRCLSFQNSEITPEQFYEVCCHYPSIVKLDIHGGIRLECHAILATNFLRNLETLVLSLDDESTTLSSNFFGVLEGCSTLKSLSIMNASIGELMQHITIINSKLQVLNVIRCRVHTLTIGCPQLKVLSLLHCKIGNFMFSSKLTRENIGRAAIFCPLLTSLQIAGGLGALTQQTFNAMSQKCVHLRVLNASDFSQFSFVSVVFPELSVLKLNSCQVMNSTSVPWICKSLMLEVLEICNCHDLDSLSLNLRNLRTLKLDHCDRVADLSLESHRLSSVTVSSCVSLHSINLTSDSLQKLVLQGLDSLTILALDCPGLRAIHLTENKSLMNFVCDVFNDGGGCPALASLVLDSSKSLTAVKLQSTSLVSISLVDCRAMVHLELRCPYLKQLSIGDCNRLETALLHQVDLKSLNLAACPRLTTLEIEAFQLEVLELIGYGSLLKVSVNCPRLMSLDTSFCFQLKDVCLDAMTTTCLESLILTSSCSLVTSDGLNSLGCLTHLTLLDLSYTYVTSLEPIFASCLHLENLKLQACKYLTDSSLDPIYRKGALPYLRKLDLSHGCQSRFALKEFLLCTRLTHLSLSGCVNLHDLDSGDSSYSMVSLKDVLQPIEKRDQLLQCLSCVGCPNIKKVFIPEAGRWIHLSSLNLSLSMNLKEVDLACSSMRYLNLNNCSSLEILKLDCPRLTSLFLHSCNVTEEMIKAVVSGCGELKTLDVRDCMKIFFVSIGKLRAACPSLQSIFRSSSNYD